MAKVFSRGGVGVHNDWRENFIVDTGHPILAWKAGKELFSPSLFEPAIARDFPQGLPRIGSQNSEDALSWNVFRSLQRTGKLSYITQKIAPDMKVSKVYFWGHDPEVNPGETAPEIQDALNDMEPWGWNGTKQQTETDVLLRGNNYLIMIECKLGKPGEKVKAWVRSRPAHMRPEYKAFMNSLRTEMFNSSFDYERDGKRFCQLFRNYLLGKALSLRWGTEFSLLVIVNERNKNLDGRAHEEEFRYFQQRLTNPSNTFLLTWQHIRNAIIMDDSLRALSEYLSSHILL